MLWESSEINLVELKKIRQSFQNFLKIRPLRENPRSASVQTNLKKEFIYLHVLSGRSKNLITSPPKFLRKISLEEK